MFPISYTPVQPADFVVGGLYYGNDNDNLSGRYQALHFSGWTAAQDLTSGTANATQIALPTPPAFESIELLEICMFYVAATSAKPTFTTAGNLVAYKTAAGTSTPGILLVAAAGGIAGAGLTIYDAPSIPINTVQKFSLATLTATTFATAQCGLDGYSYPTLSPGDMPYLLYTQQAAGGTHSVYFGYTYRERYVIPSIGTLATSGSNITFS